MMRLKSLISASNMLIGGTLIVSASVITWHFTKQDDKLNPVITNSMALSARTIMVTGASRGLGLEYVKQLVKLSSPPEVLIAACRDPKSSKELQAVASEHPAVKIIKLDVEKDEDIASAFKQVQTFVGQKGLNLLINNAAIYDQADDGTLSQLTRAKLQRHFDVNLSSPLLVTQTFLPLLQQAASQNKDAPLSFSRSGVVMMTSYMGSQQITYSDGAGVSIPYKTSKTALNMAAVTISRELKGFGILVAALHPGWVKTDMGGKDAFFTPEQSITGCLKVIGGAGEDLNGKLVTFEGNTLPY